MDSTTHWPSDLAKAVVSALPNGAAPEEAIRALFETMFFASLRTEESSAIVFHIVYLDPEKPDPNPPERIVQDRWNCVPLHDSLPLDTSAAVKLSSASDPRSSSLAVYHDEKGNLFIWGLVDQGNRCHEYVTYNTDSGSERPGLFQASIIGVGHLAAYMGFELIGELHGDQLLEPATDALARGPLHQALAPGIRRFIDAVRGDVGLANYQRRSHWNDSLITHWLAAIRRMLLRIQQYRHGGAILICPEAEPRDLNIKYQISYDRLRMNLYRTGTTWIKYTDASDLIHERYIAEDRDEVPIDLYLDETVASTEIKDARRELDGVLWFVSLLSRVDGVVLLTPDLEVSGFGGEILADDTPAVIVKATDDLATKDVRIPFNHLHLGTRHRSMMRYCYKFPGSVGLVVSQDGDVRAMTRVEEALVIWDNLRLLRLADLEVKRKR